MSVKVHLPGGLAAMARGQRLFEVTGKTVGECLTQLASRIPGISEALFYETGAAPALRPRIVVLVNGEGGEDLARAVRDGDEVQIRLEAQ